MFDFLHEILATIRRNKMRTFLTGFAVAWGIFMLIVLLGAGNGLRNGVMSNFQGQATNVIGLWPGRTSMPYGGYQSGRRIQFDLRDVEMIREHIPNLEYLSPYLGRSVTVTYGEEYGSWNLQGVSQDERKLYPDIQIVEGGGRFLNEMDVAERRKVTVLSANMKEVLFKDEDPVGKYVLINQTAFRVVGVHDDENPYGAIYIPFSTALLLYSPSHQLNGIEFTATGLDTKAANEAFNEYLRGVAARQHRFNPEDRSAVYVNNVAERALQMRQVFTAINIFILIIGLASLMAGIVGVGNIMLITVKERTREIGIRKAIGATPRSILQLIIFEAIFITTCAGYIGILLGIGLTEAAASLLAKGSGNEDQLTMFLNPTVDLGIVLSATIFLIGCGVVAGLIPALKATRVRPIEAMRAE